MLDKLRAQKQKLLDPEAGAANREPSFRDQVYEMCPSLTYQERLAGFLVCLLLGVVLSLGSTFRLAKLAMGRPGPFAIAFTIGNLLSLGSSMFFVGPCKQLQTMFRKKRRMSAILYLVFMFTTLALCLAPHFRARLLLVVLSVICQFTALIWYTLSYVPYGRQVVRSCFARVMGMAADDEV